MQKLISQVRDSNEAWELVKLWPNLPGDDRSQAIIITALLEQAIEQALGTHFVLSDRLPRDPPRLIETSSQQERAGTPTKLEILNLDS